MKVGVSACLVGKNTKYDGGNNYNEYVLEYLKDKEVVLICPEVFGGLPTPRIPSEQTNDKVINSNNEDVTKQFVDGAQEALKRLQQQNVNVVILKERSPSCGYKKIYDGTFSKTIIDGNGVFAKLAIENGFIIYTESDIENIIKNNG
jgi:uncharacterized protein YbbK (DUF523 family)